MVLDLIGLLGLPVSIATVEGIRHHQEKEQHEEKHERLRDFHIEVYCDAESRKRDQVDRSMIVLQGGKVG